VVDPDLTILVVDALIGNDAVMQAEEFHKSVSVDGTILTKVDADVKGGASLSVTYVTGKPIVFIGVGQNYEDLKPFNPEQFTQMILK
jgi:fused signal recognition particle receptor